MIRTVLILVAICCFVHGQEDLDKLIEEVFSRGATSTTESSKQVVVTPPNLQPNVGNEEGGLPGAGNCTCVPYYLCNNGSVNTNGNGIIDIRINEGPCPGYLDVCCGKADVAPEPLTPTPPTKRRVGCGLRNPDGVGFRITGDKENEAQFGEFPWMVAVLREESVEGNPQILNVYQCGGALIHPQVVVTAAHCVSGSKKTFKVRAGEWDTQTKKELFPHQDREVRSVVVHPQFYAGALYNDVALLILAGGLDRAENIDFLCLPPPGAVFEHVRCLASGWGKDVFGKEGKYQVILKKLELPMVARGECQELLRQTRLGKYFELHASFVCAGGEPGKDTCKGDGGSPLVCPVAGTDDRYYHAGIVAWGIGCGDVRTPAVYANVAHFRLWIDEQMKLHNFDTDSYTYSP